MNINNRDNTFKKSGAEFKKVLSKKIEELKMRLGKRNKVLEELLSDKRRLRSYLLRSANPIGRGHGGGWNSELSSYGQEHIGIEEVEEIKHLCGRIFQIENEIKTYQTLKNNLNDSDTVELTLQELMQYGFE